MSEYNSTTGSFKGNPTITLNVKVDGEDKRVMSFGLKKAKAIVSQLEEIKKFIEVNDKEKSAGEA